MMSLTCRNMPVSANNIGLVRVGDGTLRVVYLGGLGRSGSTLVERLLGELPGVRAVGEVVHLWERGVVAGERCGCGEAFAECEFWAHVGQAAFGGWESVGTDRIADLRAAIDRTRFIPRLAAQSLSARADRDLHEYTDYYLRVYQAIREVSGCQAIVDSSKHASLAFCLNRRPEVDLRVIHLVRDSRAVAYSWTTRVARPDASAESYMTTYSPVRAAGQWNAQNGAFQVLARRGAPVLRIRYEDLVASPAQTLGLITRFAGLQADPPSLAFLGSDDAGTWADLHPSHTASGNPMRFTTGRLAIRRDERWRTAMPARQRRTVTALTLPLLAHYGYLGAAARPGATLTSDAMRERHGATADRAAGRVGEAA